VLQCNRAESEKHESPKRRTVSSSFSADQEYDFMDTSCLSFSYLCTSTMSDGASERHEQACVSLLARCPPQLSSSLAEQLSSALLT